MSETATRQQATAAGRVIVIHGRKVVPGVAEGEALVTRDRISGWGGIDSRTGTIVETRHELRGQSFAGKVLVFPGAKGSSGWSAAFHLARLMNVAPAAFLFNEMTTKIALGAVVTHSPSMTDFDRDPLECIETGDWVRVDADRGVVEITKKELSVMPGHFDKLRTGLTEPAPDPGSGPGQARSGGIHDFLDCGSSPQ